ncbi:Toluene efflux pump outer membrane protein TtgI precursor [compost metagenome]
MSNVKPLKIKEITVLCLALASHGCISSGGIAPQSKMLNPNQLAPGAAISHAAQEAGWPIGQWWKAFGDKQLNRLLDIATRDSPDLASASARVRQARAIAGIANSTQSLQVNGDAELRRRNWPDDQFYGPGGLSGSQTWDNSANVGLRYPFDVWQKEKNSGDRSVDLAHMTAAQEKMAELEIQDSIIQTYIKLALHYSQRDVVQSVMTQQTQILDLAERRLKGGIGTEFEVAQAQTPVSETLRQIDALNEAIAIDVNQLEALAGQGPGQKDALARPDLSLQNMPALPSSLPAQLLGRRPDVVACRWNVAAQARGLDVAHANFYPNINLLGNLGFIASGGDLLAFLSADKRNYTVGPALSLPIFDGGRLRNELGEAAAEYDLAVAGYNKTIIIAFREVSDQLIRRSSLDKQSSFIRDSINSAQRTYQLALVGYEQGLSDYLEVLNAQTLLFERQKIQQDNQAERLSSYARLVVALGGGVSDLDAPLPSKTDAPAPRPSFLEMVDKLVKRS